MTDPDDVFSRLLSHRLRGFSQHEGSLAGLGTALQLDIAWVEIDTRLTADDQLLVFHDSRLDRITDTTGRVRDYSLSKHGPPSYAGPDEQAVPTLAEFLEEFARSRNSTRLMLDIKDPGTEEAHIALVRRFELAAHTWIISWDPAILTRIHQLAPELTLGFSHIPLTRARPLLNGIGRLLGSGALIRWIGRRLARFGFDHNAQDMVVYFEDYNRESYASDEEKGSIPIHLLSGLPQGRLGEILEKTGGGVGMPAPMLTRSYVQRAHQQGLGVFVYSIETLDAARQAIRRCDPDIIFTNRFEMFSGKEGNGHSDRER